MTLKDIAKEAGVSISTVSRIINGNSSNAAVYWGLNSKLRLR